MRSPLYFIFICLLFSCSSTDSIDEFVLNQEDVEENPVEETISNKPNILLIIADDMGLDATPRYPIGIIKPNMPTLESLMDSGIRFNNVWSNPTCTPTRASMLTGKFGFRTGVTKVDDVMPTSEVSIQSYLTNNGASDYTHAVIGKWHLSKNDAHPNNMGIDYFAGLTGGGVQSYTNWNLNINGQSSNSSEYTTTKFTDLAIDWIDDQSQPWFLWLAYNAPHSPFHLPPNELHSQGNLPTDQASIDANPLPYYMAMIEAMDTEIGRLISSMSQEERDNTVIIFIGDNGTPGQVVQEHTKFKAKGSVYEGGVNVPMIVSGKDVTRINAMDDSLINTTDIFATIANIAGISKNQINDSNNFADLFSNDDSVIRDYNFTLNGKDTSGIDYAIRNSTHKYLRFADNTDAFYNLNVDELEKNNLLNGTLTEDENADKEALTSELSKLIN